MSSYWFRRSPSFRSDEFDSHRRVYKNPRYDVFYLLFLSTFERKSANSVGLSSFFVSIVTFDITKSFEWSTTFKDKNSFSENSTLLLFPSIISYFLTSPLLLQVNRSTTWKRIFSSVFKSLVSRLFELISNYFVSWTYPD